jgi:methyl-accepting chemotaxis protein
VLFYRFLFALLLVSLIPVSANLYQLWQAQAETKDSVDQELVSTAKLIVAAVDNWVELNLRSSELIAKTEEIQSMDGPRQVPLLKATDSTFEWSYAAFTTDIKGQAIARSDGKPLKFYGDREYVQAILNGHAVGQQVLISRVNGKPALCLSIPVLKGRNLQGTLVQCSSLVNISDAVTAAKFGETGQARLVDTKLRLIAHGDKSQTAEKLKDLSDDAITELGITEEPVVARVNGKDVVAYSLETDLGWRLTVMQDYDDAYAAVETARFEAMIAGIVLVIGVFVFAMILGNGISRPIRSLSAIAETYSKGELDIHIPETARNDEIGELAKSIERLGSGLQVILKRYNAGS